MGRRAGVSLGDSAALPQVDQAIARVLDHRAKLAALDKEMFTALANDLSPQRKAQLAIFLAKLQRGMGPGMGPGRGPGKGAGMGPGMMGPGQGGGWGVAGGRGMDFDDLE